MTRATRVRARATLLVLVAALIAFGCNLVVGSYEYRDSAEGGSGEASVDGGGGETGCSDPTGNGGRGCTRCPPVTTLDYLNSCTAAECSPFDNSARSVTAPGARPLPAAPPPPDGGVSSSDAGGIPSCSGLPGPVYVTGATFSTTFLGKIAQSLAQKNTTLVFLGAASCTAFRSVLEGTTIEGSAVHWTADVTLDPALKSSQVPCIIDPGTAPDIAVSDVFGTTCQDFPQGALPSSITDSFGPVQALGFAVPSQSKQRSISAAAAYDVYGFGAQSGVAPWTDETALLHRGGSSGTQNLIAAAIGLPAAAWRGRFQASTAELTTTLLQQGSMAGSVADSTLGIVSSDVVQQRPDQLRLLAFQAADQTCGFWPDSTATARDRNNVREGRYPLWGPYHFFTRNPPAKPSTQQVVNAAAGNISVAGVDLLSLYAQKALVPQCAMHVARTKDGGGLKAFKPDVSCSCYFDFLTTGQSSCKTCSASSACSGSAPNCNVFNGVGYCEP